MQALTEFRGRVHRDRLRYTLFNRTSMKTLCAVLLAGMVGVSAGCSDYLDVNTNPNAPQSVEAYLYLPPAEHWSVTGEQYDGRYIGRYAQEWVVPGKSLGTYERMGYFPGS